MKLVKVSRDRSYLFPFWLYLVIVIMSILVSDRCMFVQLVSTTEYDAQFHFRYGLVMHSGM